MCCEVTSVICSLYSDEWGMTCGRLYQTSRSLNRVYQWPTTILLGSLGYIKNGFCSDSRINMGILHQKLLYQFLGDPSYHQLIADIQKGIVAKCNSDLRRKIYPACRKRITQQCSNSIQDYITPIHKLTKHKYNTLKNIESSLCKICTKFYSFDAMYPHIISNYCLI